MAYAVHRQALWTSLASAVGSLIQAFPSSTLSLPQMRPQVLPCIWRSLPSHQLLVSLLLLQNLHSLSHNWLCLATPEISMKLPHQ